MAAADSQSTATDDRQRARLRWQCRRGMLELDAMLEDFLARGYDRLDARQRAAFDALLQAPDQLLLEYLMGRMIPIDKDVADVAQRIRLATGP